MIPMQLQHHLYLPSCNNAHQIPVDELPNPMPCGVNPTVRSNHRVGGFTTREQDGGGNQDQLQLALAPNHVSPWSWETPI